MGMPSTAKYRMVPGSPTRANADRKQVATRAPSQRASETAIQRRNRPRPPAPEPLALGPSPQSSACGPQRLLRFCDLRKIIIDFGDRTKFQVITSVLNEPAACSLIMLVSAARPWRRHRIGEVASSRPLAGLWLKKLRTNVHRLPARQNVCIHS